MPGGIPLEKWSGADATRELKATIEAFNEEAAKQTATMVRLTLAIALLTLLMLVGLVVQILLAA